MSTTTTPLARADSHALRNGSGLMALASLGFIGYAGAALSGKALREAR
jgi:hypothetical protein